MIRIHLQPARRRLLPLLLLGLGIFLVSTLGLAYLTREQHPSLPPELAGRSQVLPPPIQVPAPEPAAKTQDPQEAQPSAPVAAVPAAEAPASPPAAEDRPTVAEAPPRADTRPPERVEAKAAPIAVQRPVPAQVPALPPTGPLCLRILQLHERLPAGVRCSSLSGTAGGDYTIEGSVTSGDLPQLAALLDGLQRLPSRATMQRWRAGKKEGDYGFSLHGQFTVATPAAAVPLGTGEAEGLFTQAAALARKSRLDSVRVGAPLFTPVGKGVVQQRQKVWATGSYQQLKTFLETLVRQQPQLRLDEVMLVPLYKGETQWKQAHFYAVLSTAVRAAR